MASLHVAVDASRTTVARSTGTEHYARRMIEALLALDHGHRITLYFRDAPPPDLFPDADKRVIPFRRAWTHLRFAAALWRERPDLVWVPAHTLPFVFPGRAVVTVHDLGYRLFPQAHTASQRRYLDLTTRYSAARAHLILADSQATARDLTRFYGTPTAKVRVVYPGVDPLPVGDVEALRTKYGLPARYFFFIGTLQPRKNIARLVRAYVRFRRESGSDVGLVLAGGRGWRFDPAWVQGVDGVLLPGYVDEADKGALYAGAAALTFPSLYEGFGFPVLEALGCGTPVIAANTSSLPELTGDQALLVDPADDAAIARAMHQVLHTAPGTPESRRAQAARFTWESAAWAALSALELVAAGS